MLTDVAAVIAEPVPAFELGILSEIFGLPRIDPALPPLRYAVCAATRGRCAPRPASGSPRPTAGTGSTTADLIVVTGADPPAAAARPRP